MTSSNSEAVIGGDLTGTLTEADASVSTSGQLTITDIPAEQEFVAQTSVKGLYGWFTLSKDGAWTYETNGNIDGMVQGQIYTDAFDIQSKDGTVATVKMRITGTNDLPTVSGTFAGTTFEGSSMTVTVTASDPEDISLHYSSADPDHGTIIWAGNEFTYTPDADFYGTDTFSISVIDTAGGTTTKSYSVIVYDQPDAPIGADKSVAVVENNRHTVVVGDLGFSDPNDAGTAVDQLDSVIISAVSGPGKLLYNGVELDLSKGAVTISKADIDAGKLVWSPAADTTGQAQITFRVTDTGGGSDSDHTAASSNTLTINVHANNAPTVMAANADTEIQTGSSLSLTIGDTHFVDTDGTDLTYAITVDGSALPSWMTFDTATGAFTATPATGNVGDYEITVTASDGDLTTSDTFSLSVTKPASSGDAILLSKSQIAENSAAGTLIGALSGFDGDGEDFVSFALGANPHSMFKIVGADLVVNTSAKFDFETKSSYGVEILATDNDGATVKKTFTITISDVREDPKGTQRNDNLYGDAMDNTIDGKRGNDKLTGGDGTDTFIFGKAYGKDVIQDFNRTDGDLIDLSKAVGIDNFKDLKAHHVTDVGNSLKIVADDGAALTINDMDRLHLAKDMFVF